jgi:hypothetical protein
MPEHPEDPAIATQELYPLQPLPFYGTWVWGPRKPEPILQRLYGETGSPSTMSRFATPVISAETHAFWRQARHNGDALDWAAISARFHARRVHRTWAHIATFPWWWANGAYNVAIKALRRWAR